LTACPEGTVRPRFSYGVFVFVFGAAIIVLTSFLYVRRVAAEQEAKAAKAGEQELFNMVKTLLVRLSRTYGCQMDQRSILVDPIVRIEFKGLGMTLKGSSKVLLENVSGSYNPGHLHAIMGPSGSGASVTRLM
jgi:ABC-type multidrug transport system fused ATPase/permease subunit